MKNILLAICTGILLFVSLVSCKEERAVTLELVSDSERAAYGKVKLTQVLLEAGYDVLNTPVEGVPAIRIGVSSSEFSGSFPVEKEGFSLISDENGIAIAGMDETGVLYGCMELANRIRQAGSIPEKIEFSDYPEMVLRGTCIGLQKTTYLPGRTVYEYPYTPENFPWFYDKDLWIKYLDMLVENRMNSLYLWNGHPFASLVKLEDYPYALEVDEETFRKNEEMYEFITRAANKRGIWVIQMFYNILVSKPFAEHHHIKTQDRTRPIIPVIADYTQKSIAAFIEKYPNVGLLITLGEAMNTVDDDVRWFNETIIPGVKDGLKALGKTTEPPIILRAHDTDAKRVIDAALPYYKNLYTTHKYNGESLTTYEPRGPWSQIHKDLSSLGSIHISNVHILANLEPFRYGSPDFIQKSVQAMHKVHGANALHLYPQTSYWDWPYTADNTSPRLLEMERDWIWYEAWARYAWEADRPRGEETKYWSDKFEEMYGCSNCGKYVLTAYEETGEIAPKLLRRFGITEGNRQTLLLGMLMSQLVNPYKWRVYPGFYESCGPVGEILIEYAEKEWNKESHSGETPTQIIEEVTAHAEKAKKAIDAASRSVKSNKDEFERLKNDVYAYHAFAHYFSAKVKAALEVLEYSYSKDIRDLQEAIPLMDQSISYYEELVGLTEHTYLYANSMQTAQRRIPVGGNDGRNKTWKELLPFYEEELANLKKNIAFIRSAGEGGVLNSEPAGWKAATVRMINTPEDNIFRLASGTQPFTDKPAYKILDIAEEIQDLPGVRQSWSQLTEEGVRLQFKTDVPVKLLVGFFRSERPQYLSPPTLETNAQANDRGQAEVILVNAVEIDDLPPVNVHAYRFEAGEHTLRLGHGAVVILGFVSDEEELKLRDAGLGTEQDRNVDWVFY